MEASRYPKKEAEAIDEIQIIFNLNHYEKQLTFLSEQCILTIVGERCSLNCVKETVATIIYKDHEGGYDAER